jgi:hypothetical protein
MAFYSKRLNSTHELALEKAALNDQLAKLKQDGFLSLPSFAKGKEKKEETQPNATNPLLSGLSFSHPLVQLLITLVQKRLNRNSKRADSTYNTQTLVQTPSKRPLLLRILVEFGGGYLKWKIIELMIKGITHILKKRKQQASIKALGQS